MIVIEGVPLAQARMRMFNRGGIPRVYDPLSKEKNVIKGQIKMKFKGEMLKHPRISFLFLMPIPKATLKRDLALYNSGLLKHEKKPDTDNLIKLFLDCMTGTVFEDDACVMLGSCNKVYHPEPKTIIFMHEEGHTLEPEQLEPWVYNALFDVKSSEYWFSETPFLPDSKTLASQALSQSIDTTFPHQTAYTLTPEFQALEHYLREYPASI
jgi:Holliday junction resolvase RusA-like endonuclease